MSTRCTDPWSAMIWLRTLAVQRPRVVRSLSRCLFTTANSPASTRRLYMLLNERERGVNKAGISYTFELLYYMVASRQRDGLGLGL